MQATRFSREQSSSDKGETKMFRNLTTAAAVTVSALWLMGGASTAHAHATSIGYENAGAPGSVYVWLGTYSHGGHHLEGSMTLTGVNGNPYPTTTIPFTVGAGNIPGATFAGKPAGLIDGVTNFFPDSCFVGLATTLVGVDQNCFGGVDHWQGALFTGLGAGDYQFSWTPIANPSAEWSLLCPCMDGIFTLGGVVINPNPVPEPATLTLLGLGLAGVGFATRRRRA